MRDTTLEYLPEEPTGDAGADLDHSLTLLRQVASGERGGLLRVYRPVPTLAFGRRDTRLAGFKLATEVARGLGFEPVVRGAGGRAAAYHRGCLIVDQIEAAPQAMVGHQERFAHFGDLYARALRRVGVDAHVGEIPGEYCPGEFSVHGRTHVGDTRPRGERPGGWSGDGGQAQGTTPVPGSAPLGRVKLVGTAQRVVQGAWLFSSVVVAAETTPLRAVTQASYAALGLGLDPATVGSVEDVTDAGLRGEAAVEAVRRALVSTWADAGYALA